MNLPIIVLISMLFCFSNSSQVQCDNLKNAIEGALSQEKFEKAIRLTYEIRSCYGQIGNWEGYCDTYKDIPWYHLSNGNLVIKRYLDSAFVKGIEYDKPQKSDFYSTLWYMNSRYHMEERGNYDTAISALNMTLSIDTLIYNSEPRLIGDNYQTLGICHAKKGDYKRAIEYYEYAIPYIEAWPEELANVYHNIARSYTEIKDAPNARKYYLKTLKLLKLQNYKSPKFIDYKTNFCASVDSLTCLKELLSQIAKNDHTRLARNYQHQANVYRKEGNYTKAKVLAEKALNLRHKLYGNKHPDVAVSHKRLGNIADSIKDYDTALLHYQKALSALVWGFNDSIDITKNPTLKQAISSKVELLKVLENKANTLQRLNNPSLALTSYEFIFDLIDDMRINYVGDLSIYHLLKEAVSTYESGILTALALEEKEKAFEFIARSKSVLLLENIRDIQAKDKAKIPAKLLKKERILKIDIAYYGRELFQAHQEKKTEKIVFFQAERFKKQQEYFDFLNTLEEKYPIYHQQKYNNSVADILSLRKQVLDQQTALIEFFQGEKDTYAVLLTQDVFEVYTLPNQKGLELKIKVLRQVLAKPSVKRTEFNAFTHNAYALYQDLLKPLSIPNSIQQLILIPDKQLGYIPFQALLTNPVGGNYKEARYDTLSYLLKEYQLSYAYASTLLIEGIKNPCKKDIRPFGGFAPFFDNTSNFNRNGQKLKQLIASDDEVIGIASILNGMIYKGSDAAKDTFIDYASKYKILHLATHTKLNDTEPMESKIHFIDDSLTTREIYNLPLCTELAVLSACETGIGEIRKGEGIISLARAFAQAGCPSLVSSLWQVNDSRTPEFMINFYQNLQKGNSKDEALHNAQINYLNKIRTYTEAHPHYWAAFIFIGEKSPIFTTNNPPWRILLGLGIILFLALFYLRTSNTNP